MNKFIVWVLPFLLAVADISHGVRSESVKAVDDIAIVEYILGNEWLDYNDAYGYVVSYMRHESLRANPKRLVQHLQDLRPDEKKMNLLLSGLVSLGEGEIEKATDYFKKSIAIKDGRPLRLHQTALQYLGISLAISQRNEELKSFVKEIEGIWNKNDNGVFALMYYTSTIQDVSARREYARRLFQGLSPELLKLVLDRMPENKYITRVFEESLAGAGISLEEILRGYKEQLRKERFPMGCDPNGLEDALGSKLMADTVRRFYEDPLMTIEVGGYYDILKNVDDPHSAQRCISRMELLQYLFPDNDVVQYLLGAAYLKDYKMESATHAFMRAYELNRGAIGMALLAIHGVNYTFSLNKEKVERDLYERTKVAAIYNVPTMEQLLVYLDLKDKSFKCDVNDQLLQMLFAKYQAYPDFGPRIQRLIENGIP